MRPSLEAAVFWCLFVLSASPVPSAARSAGSDTLATSSDAKWRWSLTPGVWISSVAGNVDVRGVNASLDFGPEDIVDNGDLALSLHLEARLDAWSFWLEGTYLALTAEKSPAPDSLLTVDYSMTQAEIFWGYRAGEKELWFDFTFGVRYTDIDGRVEDQSGVETTGTRDWVDPLIGFRFKRDLTARVPVLVRGEIGGFTVGSEFTWSVTAGVGVELASALDVGLAYRVVDIEYKDGAVVDRFEYDVRHSGVIFAATFYF